MLDRLEGERPYYVTRLTGADSHSADLTERAGIARRMAPTALRPASLRRPAAVGVVVDGGTAASLEQLCRAAVAATGMSVAFLVMMRPGISEVIAGLGAFRHGIVPDGAAAVCAESAFREGRSVVMADAMPDGVGNLRACAAVPARRSALEPMNEDLASSCVLVVGHDQPMAPTSAALDVLGDLAAVAASVLDGAERLSRSEDRARALQRSLTLSPSRPWIADDTGSIVALSRRLTRLVGPAIGLTVEQILSRVVDPDQREATLAAWVTARESGAVFDREVLCRTARGGLGWYRLYASPLRNEAGDVVAWHGISENVTRLRRARARLEHLAFRDALTGLHNRAALVGEIERRLRENAADGGSFALFAVDIDDFKAVNDTLGYPAGNSVLRRVADCLRSSVRQTDIVARSGADEFFVLLDSTAEPGVAVRCADRIVQTFRPPIRVDGHSVLVSPSIGITLRPRDGDSADDLLRNVDLALQRAKGEGGGTWRLFEPGMDDALRAVQALKVELRDAVPRNQFDLDFQPVVDARNGAIDCFEALIRWRHPTRGLVSPLDFIPLAETTGLIVPIGRWVLQEACRVAAAWPEHVRIAVNVSAIQIRHRDLMTAVEVALASSGLAPERLELEITESILLQDDAESLETIRQLRKRRIRIAVDDFGTGHATPRALNAFPFDKLKIDRAYVAGEATPWTLAIIRAAIAMARALGLDVVAEGVERIEERKRLEAEGCYLFQGYLFGRPMPSAEAAALIARSMAPVAVVPPRLRRKF